MLEPLQHYITTALDAYGIVPPGVLAGNYQWLGDYGECVSVSSLKYCSINFLLKSATSTNQTVSFICKVKKKQKQQKQKQKQKQKTKQKQKK